MIIITTISTEYFSLNGVNYAKIYQPLKQGVEAVGIYNVNDTRQQLVSSTPYDHFQINGVVYGTQEETIAALLLVIFTNDISKLKLRVEEKTDKGGYSGTTKDLKDELDAKAFEGLITYQTKAELDAVDPVPSDGTPAKVANDSTSTNNGYYSVVAGVWVKDADVYENTIDQNNTSKGVTGKAVYDAVLPFESYNLYEKEILTSYGVVIQSGAGTGSVQAFGDGTNMYGIKHTLNSTSGGYNYMYSRIGNGVEYSDLSSKVLKFIIKAEGAGQFRFKITNGLAWGSGDNTVATVYAQTIDFTAENDYTAEVEIDMSDQSVIDFFAEAQRASSVYQRVYYIITANDGSSTPLGTHVLRSFVFDSSQDLGEKVGTPQYNGYAEEKFVVDYVNSKLNSSDKSYTPLDIANLSVRGGTPVSLETLSDAKFRFKKELGLPNSSVVGFYIKFTYADLTDLDEELTIISRRAVDSGSFNTFKIVDNFGDWSPTDEPIGLEGSFPQFTDGTVRINIYQHIINSGSSYTSYYEGANELTILFAIYEGSDPNALTDNYLDYTFELYYRNENIVFVASDLASGIRQELVEEIGADVSAELGLGSNYIVCWGDSLTAQGGWTTTLGTLSGLTVLNAGTGGENSKTISARQGGDVMIVKELTIPATTTSVLIADRDVDGGIKTEFGETVTPLLQGGSNHVNPCKIGDVEGTLVWTGASYADLTGDWEFTRSVAGSEVVIDRPTAIRTAYDINQNNPFLMVIFIGQNGGWGTNEELILQHRRMIEHSKATNVIVLGLSSGTAASRASYEAAMKEEFGRYFISLREYLSSPIYASGGVTIVSSYGLEDAGFTPTQDDLDKIAIGQVPPQLLSDGTHYKTETRTVIGNLIYNRCRDLNIF
jgi:hypothetical protein